MLQILFFKDYIKYDYFLNYGVLILDKSYKLKVILINFNT